jgi:hypothetical protein
MSRADGRLTMKSSAAFGALCRLGAGWLLTFALMAPPATAQHLTQPLTAEEVACNERQLERLLQRMNAAKERYAPLPQLPTILLVSYSNSAGFYEGIAATAQGFRLDIGSVPPTPPYEHYLAFNLNPSVRTLLLNPRRPELAQIALGREQSSSNLVAPGSYFEITLTLDPTLGGGDPLVINNLQEPALGEPYNGFLANSTKPGRGLTTDGLLTSCHQKLTDFDRHLFAILQRMVRGWAMDEFHSPDAEIAIFRGEDPQTYRVNLYLIYEGLELRARMAVELKVAWTSGGKLTSVVMKALPGCAVDGQIGCTWVNRAAPMAILIPPVLGGAELYPNSDTPNGVFYLSREGPSDPVTINLEALLAHTTWNEPVW